MKKNYTWNQYIVKKENKSLVLETIINSSPLSRADIASITGLNKGTVSSLVSELLSESLVYESGPGKSSGGRRPVIVHFNKLAGFSIGIDLGVNYILGALTDLEGNIYKEELVRFNELDYESILIKLCDTIDYLISSTPKCPYGIVGIGIGVPGIVDKKEQILFTPNLNWKHVNFKLFLENKYKLPIIIENEANAGAYGEKKYGAGKNYSNIIYISVGIGIGVGLILNDDLYKGVNGFSGELGHMSINTNGNKCRCGNIGCWELYASEQSLLVNAKSQDNILLADDEITLENLLALAETEDGIAINLFEQVGDYLGVGINNIINIFNPEMIIIGNRIVSAKKWLDQPLKSRINQSMTFNQQDLKINFSKLTTHSTALGMAAFSIEFFFKNKSSY